MKNLFKNIFKKNSKTNSKRTRYQAWIDIETTGTDVSKDFILQVACIITDADFNILEEHEWIIKNDKNEMMELSNDFVKDMHTKTGLWERLEKGQPQEDVDYQLYVLLKRYFAHQKVQIGGNSVHFDLNFLSNLFGTTSTILSHRVLDISSVLNFMKVTGNKIELPKHEVSHDAIDDIRWSITQAKTIKESTK